MNLHATIYDFLRGHNADVSIVCSAQSISLIPKAPIPVPTGWGFDGNLMSVTLKPGDPCEATIHLNVKGFKVDKVKTI